MSTSRLSFALLLTLALPTSLACETKPNTEPPDTRVETPDEDPPVDLQPEFDWSVDRFADVEVLRYRVPGFAELPIEQKRLAYYLYRAALAGRDITYDQKYAGNLAIRRTLDALVEHWQGERAGPEFMALHEYAKRVWFSNGIHHHYSSKKLEPGFAQAWFEQAVRSLDPALLPLREGESVDALLATIGPMIFDPKIAAKRTNRDEGADPVADSASNFYAPGITAAEVQKFYAKQLDPNDPEPISLGLNSKLVREGKGKKAKLVEQVWSAQGMYGPAIREIIGWLAKAAAIAETPEQKRALELLIAYYETGDLRKFDEYNVAWVADTQSRFDTINGFIEVYDDAIGYRGTWEGVVSFQDAEATKRIATIAGQAQWFEDNAPLIDAHKKPDVVGISAKVVTVVVEAGDAAPSTPIGINLPNANWIRTKHGSKSVNLGNIVEAYDFGRAGGGVLEEFCASPEERERAEQFGPLAAKLHVDMHEVIGHASGQLEPGVGTPKQTLGAHASALEEARADLVALYYVMDPKLVELGLMPSLEVGKAEYDSYVRNGLLIQLSRLELGEQLEESHMRNRQLVALWAYEQGKPDNVIEKLEREGETFFVIRDYAKLRALFGQLLREIQRIKSQGDTAAGKALIETYGVKVDRDLHEQVLRRYAGLGIAPYAGFLQPRLVPVMEGDEIVDVRIDYPADFTEQMLEYGREQSFLPTWN
ncbi:dipeptidyl-peptidase 3 family protein [Nannocystaceae bacterium ST9]